MSTAHPPGEFAVAELMFLGEPSARQETAVPKPEEGSVANRPFMSLADVGAGVPPWGSPPTSVSTVSFPSSSAGRYRASVWHRVILLNARPRRRAPSLSVRVKRKARGRLRLANDHRWSPRGGAGHNAEALP